MIGVVLIGLVVTLGIPAFAGAARSRIVTARPVVFDKGAINDPKTMDLVQRKSAGSAVVRAGILLDRAHFSCGEIDGYYGDNLQKTVSAFQSARGLPVTGVVDPATWASLNTDTAPPLIAYTVLPEDVAGPFAKIPRDMKQKARLKGMYYESPLEGLAEKFHIGPGLLKELNPGGGFDQAGTPLMVPNISVPGPGMASRIVVEKSTSCIQALDVTGKLIAFYVATIGSEYDPLPIGEWKVTAVQRNPWFLYNSDLFWDADEKHATARIPPGPNSPVGVVWINLSKEHYGIHGTPEPSKIGHTQSHGCIRLTNWAAGQLSEMVLPGTPVTLKE